MGGIFRSSVAEKLVGDRAFEHLIGTCRFPKMFVDKITFNPLLYVKSFS